MPVRGMDIVGTFERMSFKKDMVRKCPSWSRRDRIIRFLMLNNTGMSKPSSWTFIMPQSSHRIIMYLRLNGLTKMKTQMSKIFDGRQKGWLYDILAKGGLVFRKEGVFEAYSGSSASNYYCDLLNR